MMIFYGKQQSNAKQQFSNYITSEYLSSEKKKSKELIGYMFPDLPHVLCITEHLQKSELEQISINNYRLGAGYCRQAVKRGGVSIFVHETLRSTNIDLVTYCKEQVIEACALKIETTLFNATITAIYRTPNGNLGLFLNGLDNIIRSLFKVRAKLIICGDINVNDHTDSEKKKST
jgi:exonuclease III